jgi:hypothetical protein
MPETVEMTTRICPGPPEHEFQIPKKRGRPPVYCPEHSGNGKSNEEKKVETRQPPESRPAPPSAGGSRPAPRVAPPVKDAKDEPVETSGSNATMTESGAIRRPPPAPGKPDTQSRAKAESAARQADAQQPEHVWPMGVQGRPMARIEYSAAELIPTGQYANVSVGPARITTFVDLDRDVADGEAFFSASERANLVKAVNELAEMVEGDVVAVQRSIVLDSIQEQRSANGN